MGRKKLVRFHANADSYNVVEPGKERYETIKGKWNELQFCNDNPIVLELACGRGEYTIGLAQVHPDINYVGVDLKGSRIWKASQTAQQEGLDNVAMLRAQIEHIDKFFAPREVAEIWVTFPDPQLKESRERKRLTGPRFLNLYRQVLGGSGILHLKTDSRELYDFTKEILEKEKCEILADTDDLYNSPLLAEHHGIKTTYERKYLEIDKKITYLKILLK